MAKIKVGDKITIRNQEFTICTDTRGKQHYFFLSVGARGLIERIGLLTSEDYHLSKYCKEDEYRLANKFSRVPAKLVAQNPVRANSLVKLQAFIDFIIETSNNLPETPDEIQDREEREENKRISGIMNRIFSNRHRDPIIGLALENDNLAKRVEALEKKIEELLTIHPFISKEISYIKRREEERNIEKCEHKFEIVDRIKTDSQLTYIKQCKKCGKIKK